MRVTTIVLALLVCAGFAQPVERPASFDSKGTLKELSSAAARQAGVFADLLPFDYLQLLKVDTGYVLEVHYADGTRQRRSITAAEVDGARQKVDGYLATLKPGVNQEGRGSFLFQQIPLALAWYGTAAIVIAEPSDARIGAALYLASASACYFVPMIAFRNSPMSDAQAHLSVSYGYRGVLGGFLFARALGVHGVRGPFAIMLPVSIGSQFLGYRMSRDLTLGQATLATTYEDFGALDGLMLGGAITRFEDGGGRWVAISVLAGQVSGAVWGNFRAHGWDCTEGQVIADRTGGMLGSILPVTLYYAATGAEVRGDVTVMGLLSAAGNIGGTWLLERQLRDRQLTTSGGYIVAGTTIGGALLGSGIGFLIADQGRVVAFAGSVGAAAGFWGGMSLAGSLLPNPTGHSSLDRSRFEVNYAALTGAALGYACNREFSAPSLVTFRF